MDPGRATTARRALTQLGTMAAHPIAFLSVVLYGVSWAIFSPETLEWHGLATLVTWFIALLIQRAEHRDTQALHAKLDELLHAQSAARNSLTHIDEAEPEEIEAHRKAEGRRG
ncbi:MAG: hypothetical protein EKK41_03285 [Hyphomicrobiales bacterium]|nr:MAG: hypothetical protein EKK41_03285 [Hyphomicrobiales bacterium]